MLTEHDERVEDYRKNKIGKSIIKLAQDEGKEDDNNKTNVMPLQLGAFLLSNSKRIMKNFVEAIAGFKSNDVY